MAISLTNVSIDIKVEVLTVRRLSGKSINAAFEDVRGAFAISDIAVSVILAIDELDDNLDFKMSKQLDNSSSLYKPGNCSAAKLEDEINYNPSEIIPCPHWSALSENNTFNDCQPKNAHSSQHDINTTTELKERIPVIQ